MKPLLTLATVLFLVGLSLAAGMWFASLTAPRPGVAVPNAGPGHGDLAAPAEDPDALAGIQRDQPVYFLADFGPGADAAAVDAEVAMAEAAGIHRYIVSLPLPWENRWDEVASALDRVAAADPKGEVLLHLLVNPPVAWMTAHPDEVSTAALPGMSFPSAGSRLWVSEAGARLEALIDALPGLPHAENVRGFALAGLEDGHWMLPEALDASPANLRSFRDWLRIRYGNEEALRAAWGDKAAAFDSATFRATGEADASIFLDLPADTVEADRRRYLSDATADAIAALAASVKARSGGRMEVFVPYGYAMEPIPGTSGQFSLLRILDSDIDGFIGGVSSVNRGLGGAGAFVAPVDSITARGKTWLHLDDTRTGLVRQSGNGEILRPPGLRFDDLLGVFRRNLSSAALQGVSYAAADLRGAGNLHDEELWNTLGNLRTALSTVPPEDPAGLAGTSLSVIADEESRFFMRNDKAIDDALLGQVRDVAYRLGTRVKFVLLRDVIEGRVPESNVYLILNAFRLTAVDRARLHEVFQANQATAVWMYAPGYIDETASAENISATVGMKVVQYDTPAHSGSLYALTGNWISEGEALGAEAIWDPLFYVDDETADVLARYKADQKPSAAIRFLEAGWNSVVVCEPALSVELLREIVETVEGHIAIRKGEAKPNEAVRRGANLIMLHAGSAGERTVDLGVPVDLIDLFDRSTGWTQKQIVAIPMRQGETRLFEVRANPAAEPGNLAEDPADETPPEAPSP